MGPKGASIDLTRPLQPKTFPGEWQVTGSLLSGPVRDLNFIAARRRITSHLEVIEINAARRAACPAGATLVGYIVKGALSEAAAGHTLVADRSLDLNPTAHATLVLITIIPRL